MMMMKRKVFEFGEYIHCVYDDSERETIILRSWPCQRHWHIIVAAATTATDH
jgi:hypothetical protein